VFGFYTESPKNRRFNMVSFWRRSEIEKNLEDLDKGNSYLDKVHDTIVSIYKSDLPASIQAQRIKKIKDILIAFIEIMNDKVQELCDDFERFSLTKKRASDYIRQVETPPDDMHHHTIYMPGAELVLEEEEKHEFEMQERVDKGIIIATRLDTESKDD